MASRSIRRLFNGVSFFALSTLLAASAFAQESAQSEEQESVAKPAVAKQAGVTVLKEIVVTGDNVTRDLMETASSVTIIDAREISQQKTGDATVSEVVRGVPNVIYPDNVSAPIIRGQDSQGPNTGATAFFAGTVPRATINVDGHYLSYNEFVYGATSVWDVSSVEVFRGPQTTSQGANAIAGAIIVNTNDPTFTREAAYQAEIGNYNQKRASGMLSGALIENELAGRITLDYSGRDTFIDYVNADFKRDGTDQDFRNFVGRGKLLWRPIEIPALEAKLTYSFTDSNRPSQEAAAAPFEDLNHRTTTMPSWKQKTHTGILDLSYDFGNEIKLVNQTQLTQTSAERSIGLVNGGNADVGQTNVSNEARVLYGDPSDVLSGVVGLYYAHVSTNEALYLNGTSSFDDTKDNLGLFSEASYRFADKWTLTGGLRYQRDQIQRAGNSVYTPNNPVDFDETFSALLPKVSLTYAVTDDWNVGGLISRGYNPGGVALNITGKEWMPFEEETIWNYELFTRASLLDDRLTVTSNLFYMDMNNAQYNIPVVVSPGVSYSYTINAEKAHAYGLELGADYRVLDNLALKGSVGLLKTEIDEISSNVIYEGKEFAKSPGYMYSFGASWDVTEKFNVSAQVRHLDGYYSDLANTATYAIDPYTLADVRASYKFRDELELYGYVKNVFDERSPTYMQQNRGIGGIEASMTEPRMYGLGIKGTF